MDLGLTEIPQLLRTNCKLYSVITENGFTELNFESYE